MTKSKKSAASTHWSADPRTALRVGQGIDLSALDRASTPGWQGDEDAAVAWTQQITPLLSELQERLFAASRAGGSRRILLVIQGLDTAGKGGIARHVMGLVDPQGVRLTAFKAPTAEERAHDFLWRIRKAVPEAGMIGMWDRSHYEDLLVPLVSGDLDEQAMADRIAQIHEFERELIAQGTTIIKVALLISHTEQGRRLLERVDRPDKHWKYSPGDMDVRDQWEDYQAAYQRVLEETSFPEAPWHVIPADHKWYARLSVTCLLAQALADLDLPWPQARFDVEAERQRVRASLEQGALADYDQARRAKQGKVAKRARAMEAAIEALPGR